MYTPKLAACLIAMLLSACATNGPVTIDTACDWVQPIMISKDDQLTPDTARQILNLDEQWQLTCSTASRKGSTARPK
jgi:hypothetical protein